MLNNTTEIALKFDFGAEDVLDFFKELNIILRFIQNIGDRIIARLLN